MLIPYTGAALATYERIHKLTIYEANKLYPFNGFYYFINTKGYMHILTMSALNFNNQKRYYIADNLLTKSNTLKESAQVTKLYNTKPEAIQALKEIIENE